MCVRPRAMVYHCDTVSVGLDFVSMDAVLPNCPSMGFVVEYRSCYVDFELVAAIEMKQFKMTMNVTSQRKFI